MATKEPNNLPPIQNQSRHLNLLSLERIIFLKFLYPDVLINEMEKEEVIGYTKEGVKVIQDDSHMTNKRFNNHLSELNRDISFCPFLIGYSRRLSSAFRHTPWVQKILKKTNSHIISLNKYNKFKQALFEKHKELKNMKEQDLLFQLAQPFSILVTFSADVEQVKEQLLVGQGSFSLGDCDNLSNTARKYRAEFSLKKNFEEEPKVSLQFLKKVFNKYEKKVSILHRIELFKGKYRLSFGLTTFSDSFLLDIIGEELVEQFQDRRDIRLNHFELMYYKKVLEANLKKIPAFSQISVSMTEYGIDWNEIFSNGYAACNLALQGRKTVVMKVFEELKTMINGIYTKRVEIPVGISGKVYYEFFQRNIANWINTFEQKNQDIVFSISKLTSIQEDRRDTNQKRKNIIEIYVIGPASKAPQIDRMGDIIRNFLSSLRFDFYHRSIQQLQEVSKTHGYSSLDQLAEGFELVLNEAFKKEKNSDPTLIYGREEDIISFKSFVRNYSIVENVESLEYLRALQNKSDDLYTMANQHQVQCKAHPYLPKLHFSGEQNAVESFRKLFQERLSQLKKETKFYPVDPSVLFWAEKPVNRYSLQSIEKKYKVFFILGGNVERTEGVRIGILDSKPQHLYALDDLKTFALGNIVEREIQLSDPGTLKECLVLAEKEGFEARVVDNSLLLKGHQNKIQEFKENISREQRREARTNYPHKYWDFQIEAQIMIIDVSEMSPEYKSMSSLFSRNMEKSKIRKIQRIQNNYLLERFKRMEMLLSGADTSTISLFYGTKNVDPAQIYEDFELGFDYYFSNSENENGFYFTFDAATAHENYAYHIEKNVYQMLIADVIAEKGSLCTRPGKKNQYFIDNGSKCYPLYLIEYEQRL